MINRRQLITSAIVATTATSSQLARAQSEPEKLDTGEVVTVGLSPDASTLVGVVDGESLVFIDLESLEIVAQSAPMPELEIMEHRSLSWNPAGTQVAFSLDVWRLMRDSDIFVADTSTGKITNLTSESEGNVAASVLENPGLWLDVYPTWMDDESLVFARHVSTMDLIQADLYTIGTDGDEPEQRLNLAAEGFQFVTAPIFVSAEGRIVTQALDTDMVDAIIMIDQDGAIEHINLPDAEHPILLEANDSHALVTQINSEGPMDYWLVSFDDPAEVISLPGALAPDELAPYYILPILGPDQKKVLCVSGEDREIIMKHGDDVRVVGILPGEMTPTKIFWSGSTVILAHRDETWRLDIEG